MLHCCHICVAVKQFSFFKFCQKSKFIKLACSVGLIFHITTPLPQTQCRKIIATSMANIQTSYFPIFLQIFIQDNQCHLRRRESSSFAQSSIFKEDVSLRQLLPDKHHKHPGRRSPDHWNHNISKFKMDGCLSYIFFIICSNPPSPSYNNHTD